MTATARLSASRKNPFNVAAFANKRDVWMIKGELECLNLRFYLSFLNVALRTLLRSARHRDPAARVTAMMSAVAPASLHAV